ncbi:hypothetical protein FOCC_FOCC000067 [Frankliniella occidentalis]|nr:hypothetical protein FOCC_FOCC000067 [Frankliniella occidentalis]
MLGLAFNLNPSTFKLISKLRHGQVKEPHQPQPDVLSIANDDSCPTLISMMVDAKFLRNQRFAKKHNLKPKAQLKMFEKRKAAAAFKAAQKK